jgi:hypothetical protein
MTHESNGPDHTPADTHREWQDLLPWLVNGTLGAAERARIERHLEDCEDCRAELALEQDLHRRMSAEDRIAYSPAASFEKLWSRIEELEREVPIAPVAPVAPAAPVARFVAAEAATPAPDLRAPVRRGRVSTVSRWLVAAVVVQALALGWLGANVATRDAATPPWVYRTVTTPATVDPALPRFRVVFAGQATVADQQDLLARRGLVIVGGPSQSGVYVVAPAGPHLLGHPAVLLADLRAEEAVRYVELAK